MDSDIDFSGQKFFVNSMDELSNRGGQIASNRAVS
jgi:hypothetical protein